MAGKRRMSGKMCGLALSLLLINCLYSAGALGRRPVRRRQTHQDRTQLQTCTGRPMWLPKRRSEWRSVWAVTDPIEKLAKRTDSLMLNWHANPHYGDLDCNDCHHGHRADENSCKKCHNK